MNSMPAIKVKRWQLFCLLKIGKGKVADILTFATGLSTSTINNFSFSA